MDDDSCGVDVEDPDACHVAAVAHGADNGQEPIGRQGEVLPAVFPDDGIDAIGVAVGSRAQDHHAVVAGGRHLSPHLCIGDLGHGACPGAGSQRQVCAVQRPSPGRGPTCDTTSIPQARVRRDVTAHDGCEVALSVPSLAARPVDRRSVHGAGQTCTTRPDGAPGLLGARTGLQPWGSRGCRWRFLTGSRGEQMPPPTGDQWM
jgi:hypothetical protein